MFRILFYNKYNIFFVVFTLFFSSQFLYAASAKDFFEQAQEQFSNFKFFEASGSLQKALKINPYYTDAQILLGDAYFAMGNFSAAWETYITVEKRDPNNPDLLIKLAQTKLELAQTREEVLATEYYLKKAYKIAPRNSQIAVVYGEFYMRMNDYDKAMEYYQSLGSTVDNTEIYINKSNIYQKWGQNEKALEELKKAEKLDSKNYNVLLEIGKIYSKLNQSSEALVYLNTAYSYNQKDRQVLQALADLYIKENNFADASHKISQLILNDSSNPVLYYNLALCYESLGDFSKTVEVLEQGLQFDYSNEFLRIKAEEVAVNKLPISSPERVRLAEFYKIQADNLQKNNREQETLFFLKRALRLEPLNVQTRLKIADIYRKKAFLYEYIKLLQGGLFLNPQDIRLRDQLMLNQKFVFNSLESKEKLEPQPFIPLEPILRIQDAVVDHNSYRFFASTAKEIFLESLLNNHTLNAFIGENTPSQEAQFDVRFTLTPYSNRIEVSAEVIYIPTGSTYLEYKITEYGNNRMIHAFKQLADSIEKDIPKVARILKIDGNTAIINIGAQQGIKLGQNLKILNNPDLPNKFFSVKSVDHSWEVASAQVVELGENISKITFKPLDDIVFNMVQQNQSIIIE